MPNIVDRLFALRRQQWFLGFPEGGPLRIYAADMKTLYDQYGVRVWAGSKAFFMDFELEMVPDPCPPLYHWGLQHDDD